MPADAKVLKSLLFGLVLLLAACGAKKPKSAPPTPEVGYVVLTTQSTPLEIELAGRTTAYETADVRPQVSGLIMARRFQEGSIVHAGETLYEIDPRLYRAAAAQAQANLAYSEAARDAAVALAVRYRPLAEIEAVAKQDYANAAALAKQSVAQVALNKAALDIARINLVFTRVPAPITGRIGRSFATTGALVTSGQVTALSTIQRLDPIFVDIPQSAAELVGLRHSLAKGGATPASAVVRLIMEDGSEYPHSGQVEFSEAMVDPNTGTVTIRARFPNPTALLLPGMYVRARFSQVVVPNAILAPQQGVARNPRGAATVMLVGPNSKAVLQPITTDRTVGTNWLVTSGVKAGDKVIVEGLDRIKAGQTVRPVPAGSPPRQPSAGGASPK